MTGSLKIGPRSPVSSTLPSQRTETDTSAKKTSLQDTAGTGNTQATAENKAPNDLFAQKEKNDPHCTFTSAALTSGKNQTHISPGTRNNPAAGQSPDGGPGAANNLWGAKKTSTAPAPGDAGQVEGGQGSEKLGEKGGLLSGSMRSAQIPFNQTMVAWRDKDAGIIDRAKFSGICFILSLHFLESKAAGDSDEKSISKFKEPGNFHQLWDDFAFHNKNAENLKGEISGAYVGSMTQEANLRGQLAQAPASQHADINQKLQSATLTKTGAQSQLERMFVGGGEQGFELSRGGVPLLGKPGEQIMRKLFSMDVADVHRVELTVVTKRLLTADKLNWSEACADVAQKVGSAGTPALFEIGLYGKDGADGHSIALHVDAGGSYSLFDPNYGVFKGDGTNQTFGDDLTKLLETKYPKHKQVVLSTLTQQ
ncbi:YopT-type cysteine protease domain-containing protein [Myxococcus landrumensis]|uniref:Peptidase C58 YopT-type domain-containing protein n=1 Tax=Myxococcus landrumensis TaxID=2813577 RepID=A0ABX7NEK9_9BACT|nr:YopT-type cysteine protease domain-containing protein [Myxococcus landrumus]QSQ17103.1 hypothetical protein JY572_14020 [Myxococcus landrumus]